MPSPLFHFFLYPRIINVEPRVSIFSPMAYNLLPSLIIWHSNCPDLANKSAFKLVLYEMPVSFLLALSYFPSTHEVPYSSHTFPAPILKSAISLRKA